MLQKPKNKSSIEIVKSGLVGAFALTSLFVILVILSAGSQTLGSLFRAIFKIVPTIPGLFIIFTIFGAIGFVLGVVLGRRFPIIQRGILPLFIAFFMLVLPLGFVTWISYKASMQVEYPSQEMKLADCTNNVVSFHLNAQRGHDYQLQLRIPGIAASSSGTQGSSYHVSGHLNIFSGATLLANMPIGSDKAWVNGADYGVTIVGLQNANVLPLSKLIQSHKDYDFEIALDAKPPTNTSIWIEWWEAKADK